MSYLNRLTQSLQESQQRRQQSRSTLRNLLAQQSPVVEAAKRKVAATHNGPFPGDGHKHSSGLDKRLWDAFQRMAADAPGSLKINSGYRDIRKQEQLWQQALKKYGDPEIADNWVARPGKSSHNSGLAIDIGYENDAVKKWVHANAGRYGLRFPMSNEPWHIELA